MKKQAENISFDDLSELRNFELFCDILGDILDIKIGLVDPVTKKLNTFERNPQISPVCSLIHTTDKGIKACIKTDTVNWSRIYRTRKDFSYICHAGLVDIAVPVIIEGNHIATILAGQFFPYKPTPENFTAFYEKVKTLLPDREKAREAFLKNPFITEKKLKNVVRLLSLFAEYLSEKGMKLKVGRKLQEREEISSVKKYTEENFREPVSLKEVAAHVSLSPVYLSSLFKKQTGYAFMDYLQKLRIEEAKKLLKTTGWDMLRICLESGFRNQSHFNRAFKKATGKSPLQFKK
jgi:AraC-like DNA-binding protein/ligand-binding sensor protein